MKKFLAGVFTAFFLLTGCGQKNSNITFTAIVDGIHDNSIMVTTTDDVSFDFGGILDWPGEVVK